MIDSATLQGLVEREVVTIVAAVKSRDCLVIGTDSMTQVIGTGEPPPGTPPGTPQLPPAAPRLLKGYSNATKLFQLGDLPIGVATWGAGNIGSLSVGGLVSDYQPPAVVTVQAIAEGLAASIQTAYNDKFGLLPPIQMPVLGFFVGGYSNNQLLSEVWEIRFPGQTVTLVRGQQDFGANWRGIERPFTRLHFGVDPRIAQVLSQAGVAQPIIQQVLRSFESPVIFDSMPIQDAIGFAEHILRTTIAMATYEIGFPSCGEPIQIAVIMRRKGFTWVNEPKFHV